MEERERRREGKGEKGRRGEEKRKGEEGGKCEKIYFFSLFFSPPPSLLPSPLPLLLSPSFISFKEITKTHPPRYINTQFGAQE